MTVPSSSQAIYPGYKHVESFSKSVEYEEGDEIEYLVLDLGSRVEPTLLSNSKGYRLIGIDTPNPVLQLAGTVLRGKKDPLIGSELLFKDAPLSNVEDEDDFLPSKVPLLEPLAIAHHRVSFNEVTLKPKGEGNGDIQHPLPRNKNYQGKPSEVGERDMVFINMMRDKAEGPGSSKTSRKDREAEDKWKETEEEHLERITGNLWNEMHEKPGMVNFTGNGEQMVVLEPEQMDFVPGAEQDLEEMADLEYPEVDADGEPEGQKDVEMQE